MTPEYKSSDAGNSDMPERNCRMSPLSEKVKAFDIRRKEKKNIYFLRFLRSTLRNSTCEIVKKEK